MKVYIASGWFTPHQELARLEIKETLEEAGIDHFSPKDDNLAGEVDHPLALTCVFDTNVDEIEHCDLMIASTIGKDMGTLFECGVAYKAGIPIVYYAPGLKGNFNLMLAQSAHAVATSRTDLEIMALGRFPQRDYVGRIE